MTDDINGGQPSPQKQQQVPQQVKVVGEAVRIVVKTMVADIIANTRGAPLGVVMPLIAEVADRFALAGAFDA
jgi:hypothetical protein